MEPLENKMELLAKEPWKSSQALIWGFPWKLDNFVFQKMFLSSSVWSSSALQFHLEHVDCVFVITSFVIVDSEKCFEECWIKNPKIHNYLLETLFNGRHKYNVKLKLWINQLLLLNKSIFRNTHKFEDDGISY